MTRYLVSLIFNLSIISSLKQIVFIFNSKILIWTIFALNSNFIELFSINITWIWLVFCLFLLIIFYEYGGNNSICLLEFLKSVIMWNSISYSFAPYYLWAYIFQYIQASDGDIFLVDCIFCLFVPTIVASVL